MEKTKKIKLIFLEIIFVFNIFLMIELGIETRISSVFFIICSFVIGLGSSILFIREINEDQIEKMKMEYFKGILIEALQTDGNHHKQWYLEVIAKQFKIDLNQLDYDKGIEP